MSNAKGRNSLVLEPLAEIAPETILPGQSVTVAELLARLEADETLTRL